MPFHKTLNPNDISNFFDAIQKKAEKELIDMFVEVGHKCLLAMESDRGYRNVTFNLSDSRGFVVVKNRVVIYSSVFKSTTGGQTGQGLAHQRAANVNGIGLVIVAGMHYAEHLEAIGKQVYTAGYLTAEHLIPKMLNQLGYK